MRKIGFETLSLIGASLLAACGGSGGVTAITQDSIIGVNANTGANPALVTLVETTAVADADTGLRANFPNYTFASDGGFENGVAIENGNTIGVLTTLSNTAGTDLRVFDGAYDPGKGVVGIYYGIAGVTPVSALPQSGTAVWTGRGFADLVTATGTSDLGSGAATMTAHFDGAISAEITGLAGVVDRVNMPDLTIAGHRFSGTVVQTTLSGGTVNAVGANAAGDIAGVFSGAQNTSGVPDEVGGLFTLTGDDATLIGGFVAD